MTLQAVGGASIAFPLLNSASGAASRSAFNAASGDTTTVTSAADGRVTTTVTAPNGTVISVTVSKPLPERQAANPNALLDVRV